MGAASWQTKTASHGIIGISAPPILGSGPIAP